MSITPNNVTDQRLEDVIANYHGNIKLIAKELLERRTKEREKNGGE